MTVFTADDMPPYPPVDPLDDAHPHLRDREALFLPAVDPALRDGRAARPDTIHIRQRRAA